MRADETIGRVPDDAGSGEWNVPEVRKLLDDVLRQNLPFYAVDVSRTCAGIGGKTIRLSGRKIERRKSGEPLMLLAILHVSEQRTAVDALRASEERHQTLVESAQHGVWTTTFANSSMAAMLGTTVDAMVGKSAFSYVFAEDAEFANERFARKLAADRATSECRLCRSERRQFVLGERQRRGFSRCEG